MCAVAKAIIAAAAAAGFLLAMHGAKVAAAAKSRIQPLQLPLIAVYAAACVSQSVMQSAWPALPELDRQWPHKEATPVVRFRDRDGGVFVHLL